MIQSISFPYIRLPSIPSPAFPNRTFVDCPALITNIEYRGKVFPQNFYSIIDSGADHCAFPSTIGSHVGIDVPSGPSDRTTGVAGTDITYYHQVKIWFQINQDWYHFDCYAGFLRGLDQIGMGLLGRHGFFDLLESITLDNKRTVELRLDIP